MNKEYKIVLTLLGLSAEEVVHFSTELEKAGSMLALKNFRELVQPQLQSQFDLDIANSKTIGDLSNLYKKYGLRLEQFEECQKSAHKETIEKFVRHFLQELPEKERNELQTKMRAIFKT
ncbi:hypothetical protein IT417_01000 [bacterium]|nr:hypothetical protein [bacterium]